MGRILLVFIACVLGNSCCAEDSASCKKHFHLPETITYSTNASASYVHYKNWKYNGANSYSFLVRSTVCYDTTGQKRETHIRLNAELGYMKFIDSSWNKSTDYIDLSAEVIKNTSRRLDNVFSFYFNSQLLPEYEMYFNDSGHYSRRKTGSFGNPMTIDLGYGATLRFWKTCRVNLTFVTLRTSTVPILESETLDRGDNMIYKKTLITSEYGLSLQTYIRRSFGSRVRWENYSRFFGNAVNRQKFDIDFRNRVIVKIFKYLDFIIDSKIRYTPYPPYKFQFKNELMLSFTFEKV